MVRSQYDWDAGAEIKDHSLRKHKILREYFAKYLRVRCVSPFQEKFRLAVVDGFCGGGSYQGGAQGSPLIFLEELKVASTELNAVRSSQGLKPITIECLLILNDKNPDAIEGLKLSLQLIEAEIRDRFRHLRIELRIFNQAFEEACPEIEELLRRGGYQNALFNLDQYGHNQVDRRTLQRIMRAPRASTEVFYTFSIQGLVSFLKRTDPAGLKAQLRYLDLPEDQLGIFWEPMSKGEFLGVAERLVFEAFESCGTFHSPFSINNPGGWRYWLIHFSRSYRARQVYNDVLHSNSTAQAHFGRSGLNMLSYDPMQEGGLYLFDLPGREQAKEQLAEDIPRLVAGSGDAIQMEAFYEGIYNQTPAHADDIHETIMDHPDLEVLTDKHGKRRRGSSIRTSDVLRLKEQRTFFPLFSKPVGSSG
ncbi:three-Cys-motif partner protein TcmP [Salipiger mucosus]|uniref:GMT-like wHTH domain-containing protein n=1 Tax=Salipiger mucosus DSM 16094 TaxID=1123237 RepID=S9Q9U3_9RHOB|nr:three-Cys-motif partner protein TcmP [Salipiger mucosus]EPX76408.1 hypothetical protein Salmuc_02910 [Salipiger mucosus DSM 16094]